MRTFLLSTVVIVFFISCKQNPSPHTPPLMLTPKAQITISESAFLLDVRTLDEHQQKYIPVTDAVIPYDQLVANVSDLPDDPSTQMVLYCHSGRRSAIAVQTVTAMGYMHVKDIVGGIVKWEAEGNRVCKTVSCE